MKKDTFKMTPSGQSDLNMNLIIPFEIMIKSTKDPMMVRKLRADECEFKEGCSGNIFIGSSVKGNVFKKNSKNNIFVAKDVSYNSFGDNVHDNIIMAKNENVFWLEPKSNFWTKIKLLFNIYKSLRSY